MVPLINTYKADWFLREILGGGGGRYVEIIKRIKKQVSKVQILDHNLMSDLKQIV